MTILVTQNDFTHGEFDPRLFGRFDLSLYRKAAEKLRNVFIITQGGAIRRPGTKFIDPLTQFNDNFQLQQFEFSTTECYIMVFTDLQFKVYRTSDDTLVATVVTTWPAADIRSLQFTQTTNLMVVSHPNHAPRVIDRDVGDEGIWNLADLAIEFTPAHIFDPSFSGSFFKLGAVTIGTGIALTRVSGTFDFTADFVGGIFSGKGPTLADLIGFARITAFVSAMEVTVQITAPFATEFTGAAGVTGKDVVIGEPAWSVTRGWPNAVTFYQDRLWFGGSKSLPQTLFASATAKFGNFETGTGLATDAIIETIATNRLNKIEHLIADRTLQVFTFNAEFAPSLIVDTPITPTTFRIDKQTNNGSSEVKPVVLDNRTLYVKRGGKGVMSYVFDENARSYESNEVSLLSPQLIRTPVDSSSLKGSTRDDSDYYFLVNDDGSLAVYQTRANEDISAWTLSTTEGEFKGVEQAGDFLYLVVKRSIEATDPYYLEKLDFNLLTDSALSETFGSPTSTITGLGHLEGETVSIIGDGFILESKVVSAGSIELTDNVGNPRPVTTVEVGLNYIPEIIPLPIMYIQDGRTGQTAFIPKRYVRVFVQFHESLGIFVNGVLIPFLQFGDMVLDQEPIPQSGIEELRELGWERRPTISITQEDPLPMTILAIGYEVGL